MWGRGMLRLLAAGLVLGAIPAWGQNGNGNGGGEEEQPFAEAPFEVGDRIPPRGHTIERADAADINFRFVEGRIRVYWVDGDGLVVEPESRSGSVRFRGSVRGRPYHQLKQQTDEAALGAPYRVPPPHSLNVLLYLEGADGGSESFAFRYVPSMDEPPEEGAAE